MISVDKLNDKDINVQDSYDKIAKYFFVTRVFTWKWTDNFITSLSQSSFSQSSFVLDIGSGSGRNMNYHDHTIFGIDLSLEQLKQCSNSKSIIQANMINIPFKNSTFDAIISIASFHHLSTIPERHQCLKEMKRVLKPSGKILLSVWSINQPNKTKRKFDKYGDTIVNWNTNKKINKYPNKDTNKDTNKNTNNEISNLIIPRYYYIFELNEIKDLLKQYFTIEKYYWDCGNEIFELTNN